MEFLHALIYGCLIERVPYFSVLLIVAYEVTELLLSALQSGIKLLHLVNQVCFLRLQTLTVRLHGYKEAPDREG